MPTQTADPADIAAHALTAAERARYEQDGFLVLRARLDAAYLADLQAVFAEVVDRQAREWLAAGRITDLCADRPFATRLTHLRRQLPATFSNSWRRIIVSDPVYRAWQQPGILGPAVSLLGQPLHASATWNGRPRAGLADGPSVQTIDWHQDAHYLRDYDPADGRTLSVWFPLVPVDARSGCLQVCRGSHHGGLRPKVRLERNGLVGLADAEIAPYEIVSCSMDPGDILLFNELTFHRSVDNSVEQVRWSLDIRYHHADSPAVAKGPDLGYRCYDPAQPNRVDPYPTWAAKYSYDGEF